MSARVRDKTLFNDLALAGASSVALIVVLALVFGEASSATGAPVEGRSVIGNVERRVRQVRRRLGGDLVWDGLPAGARIYESDAVFVGENSEAVILLDDGARIDIDASSLVIIHRADEAVGDAPTAVAVEILRGGASGRAGRHRLDLRAGRSSARLRQGTRARVRLGVDATARVAVSQGQATVSSDSGDSFEVGAGELHSVDAAGNAGEVERFDILLAAPAAGDRRFVRGDRSALQFSWKAAAGNGPYTVEVAADPAFEVVERRARTDATSASVRGLVDGIYYWHVIRRGPKGRTLRSEERRLSVVEDRPPVAYRPMADAVVDLSEGRALSVAWSEVPDVEHYVLEIARGRNFKTPLFALRLTDAVHLMRPEEVRLQEDEHCMRVRSDAPQRGVSPWSRVVCFRVVTSPVLPAPDVYVPVREDDGEARPSGPKRGSLLRWLLPVAHAAAPPIRPVVLRWEKLGGAVGYVIEIAENRAFTKSLVRQRVDSNYFRWQPPARRAFYYRVRGIDADGREGKVSAPQMVPVDLPGPPGSTPADGAVVSWASSPPRVALKWKHEERYTAYEVELASDVGFTKELARVAGKAGVAQYRPERLGDVFWRVYGIRQTGERSLAGPASRFRLAPAVPRPVAASASDVELTAMPTPLRLAWTRRPVSSFELQVASDDRFKQRLARLTPSTPAVAVPIERPGTIYWRVRTLKPTSAWGPTTAVTVRLAKPKPSAPPDGTSVKIGEDPIALTLGWVPVPAASGYRVDVEWEPTGEPIVGADLTEKAEPVTTGPFPVVAPPLVLALDRGGSLRWRITALGEGEAASETSAASAVTVTVAADEVDPGCGDNCVEPLPGCTAGVPCIGSTPCFPGAECPSAPRPGTLIHTVFVAPRLGFHTNFGEIITPRVGAEIAYRVPMFGGTVGATLAAGYFTDSVGFTDSGTGIRVESRLHGVPVHLVGTCVYDLSMFRLVGGAGVGFTYERTNITADGDLVFVNDHTSIAAVVQAGAERELGPGSLFGELSFTGGSRSRGVVETRSIGLTVTVGYRLSVLSFGDEPRSATRVGSD